MASPKEFGVESVTGYDDEDIRGDGKKRKFKPLSAMKKFFTKKREKKESVVAIKAKSTTALHSGYRTEEDEDDDDGGFKNHAKPSSLAGNRSLSEDSVFSPESRGQTVVSFPKSAVSEESLPKSAFQSELLTKLNKRRSQYSDDEHDDGLPRSPVPPITTADVILGGPLKKQTKQSGRTRDSDQSLISVDNSENEEEDLFLSKWKSSVPARKSGPTLSASPDGPMDTFDLNSIQKTELLVSNAAKDRIMVKPKRKGQRPPRKAKDTPTQKPLPSLNEESPTRSKPEEVQESWIPGSPAVKSPDSDGNQPYLDSASGWSQTAIDRTGHSVANGNKPNLSSIVITSKGNNPGSPLASPSSSSPPVVMPSATSPPPAKVAALTSSSTGISVHKTSIPTVSSVETQLSSSLKHSPTAEIIDSTPSPTVHERGFEKSLSLSDKGDRSIVEDVDVKRLSQSQKEPDESYDLKSRINHHHTTDQASSKSSIYSSAANSSIPLPLKTEDSDNLLSMSAKEELRTRRQIRSKTLPAAADGQTSPRVQRSSSHRITFSSTGLLDHAAQITGEDLTTSLALTTSGVKKLENMKFNSVDSPTVTTVEPAWISMVRKKKDEKESNIETDSTKCAEIAVTKSSVNTTAAKPVSLSTGHPDKKWGAVETMSYKTRELAEGVLKKVDSPDTKQQNMDVNPQSKRKSVDVSSTKRESIDIEISQLGSVKASRSLFDSNTKMNNQKDIPPSISSNPDRSRPLSGSFTIASAFTTTSIVKPASVIGSEPIGSAFGASDNARPSSALTGITHLRGGSGKSSTIKPADSKPGFTSHGENVKGSSSPFPIATTTSNQQSEQAAVSIPVKAETSSKPDNSRPSSSASSSQPVPMHVTAQLNPNSLSQTPSVTPVSFSVKPFVTNTSKPGFASASKPASSDTQPCSKPTAAITVTPASATSTSTTHTAYGGKPTTNASAINTAFISNAKTPTASSGLNISSSLSSTMPVVPLSSSTLDSKTVTNTSSASSSSIANSIRMHSSFTASTASKPHITSSSHTARTSSINKSPSFKAPATLMEKALVQEKAALEEMLPEVPSKVPAWRTHLATKEVKIELIENSPSTYTPQSKPEIITKGGDRGKLTDSIKKTEVSSNPSVTTEPEKTTRRSSKVLDMVKNFQNLQAPA